MAKLKTVALSAKGKEQENNAAAKKLYKLDLSTPVTVTKSSGIDHRMTLEQLFTFLYYKVQDVGNIKGLVIDGSNLQEVKQSNEQQVAVSREK